MTDLELRHLRSLRVLAEELHFGRAAMRLGITQPSLTQQIASLERTLGYPVVRRRPKVALTPSGEELVRVASAALDLTQEGLAAARRIGRGETGRLVLGFGSSILLTGLSDAVRRYQRRFPEIHVELRGMTTVMQAEALRSGAIDISLTRAPAPSAELETLHVDDEGLMLAVPARHALAGKRAVPWERLRKERLLCFTRSSHPRLHDTITERCRAAGFEARMVQESAEVLTLLALVDAGMGIAILPDSIRHLKLGHVRYATLKGPPVVDIQVCWRRGETSPAVHHFVSMIRERAG